MLKAFIYLIILLPFAAFAQFNLSGKAVSHADKKPVANAQTIVQDSTSLSGIVNKFEAFSSTHPTEKVHLHLDKPRYSPGDTIWFKAYTVAGVLRRPSTISNVLYAELINDKDTVIDRIILQLNHGIGHGDFALPYSYKSGIYRLRAYTNWMRNDSAFFEQKIIIGGLLTQSVNTQSAQEPVVNTTRQTTAGTPDIQFFPEGGDMVNGLRSKIAFKVINKYGQPENITGVITDQSGNEAAAFGTEHAGMGEFALTPQQGKQYSSKIICADGTSYKIDLPKVKDAGFTLTVNNTGDSIYVKVAANEVFRKISYDTVFYLIAQSGGKNYYAARNKLTGSVFTAQIAKSRFPTGIVQFTLFSQNGDPLNERIIFVQNNDQLKLALSAEKQTYAPKEKIKVNLETTNSQNKAIVGSFSASVTDETNVPVDEPAETTILTDLLLTSDLKGDVENPNYYFIDQNDKTRNELDLLMLTQGYRRFEWKKIMTNDAPKIIYPAEAALSLSGVIKTLANKPIPNGKIQITSIKDRLVADTLSDANGNFTFAGLELPDTAKIVINAKKVNGSNNVKIYIKEHDYPAVNKVNRNVDDNDSSVSAPVKEALLKSYYTSRQASIKNVVQLKEVKIKDRKNTFFNPQYSDNMKFSANLNRPGNADEVILGDKIMRDGGGLLSDILPGKLFDVKWEKGLPYSIRGGHSISGGKQPMALIVDGGQVSASYINDINPDDVYSIEVLISGGYLAIYGSSAPNGALIITLKHGSSWGWNKPEMETVDGLITYKFKGYYRAREFYSPKYVSEKSKQIPDQRETIYWNPDVITDADGKTSFEYFNGDGKGSYRVVVEGIDAYGNLGRQVFRYKVE